VNGSYNLVTAIAALFIVQAAHKIGAKRVHAGALLLAGVSLVPRGPNPNNLIVVGNRGLGAAEGQLLGSVPSDVVMNAPCDVLIVQTSIVTEKARS
jgi:hypothetical protein